MLYWHKGGRKGTTTEKKEREYKKKETRHSLCPPLFLDFFPFLLLTTHNYSEILTYQARCAVARTACEGEKVVIFFSFSLYSIHTHACIHTHSSDKDLVFNGEFKRKIRASW